MNQKWRRVVPALALAFVSVPAAAQTRGGSPSSSSDNFNDLSARASQASNENRLDEASALYAKALAIRPRWEEGWWSLGTLEYDQDHYAKAANAFVKLLALHPRNG
ncbi:MAG TPA: hypothetical protein VKP58_00295, partial [Candidatus Acidoferrum sp.]|nr:hypothetical protein [Candidatus Acidoferrum sp.]